MRWRIYKRVHHDLDLDLDLVRMVFRLSADPTIVFIFLTIINPTLLPERFRPEASPAREKDAMASHVAARSRNNGEAR